jgi:hypothetical protein
MESKRKQTDQVELIVSMGGDDSERHTRLTTGDNFLIYGGSEQTHSIMQDKIAELCEIIKQRGLELTQMEPDEIKQVVKEVGLVER